MKLSYKLDRKVVTVALSVAVISMLIWGFYLQHHTSHKQQTNPTAYAEQLNNEQQSNESAPTANTQAVETPPAPEIAQPTAPVPEPAPAPEPEPTPAPVPTDKAALMSAAGIADGDQGYASSIIGFESTWCYKRMNGDHRPCESIPQPSADDVAGKAYGLCQALPATKMATAGADYMTNPVTQLRWCNSYAAKYGGWAGSLNFWLANRYW